MDGWRVVRGGPGVGDVRLHWGGGRKDKRNEERGGGGQQEIQNGLLKAKGDLVGANSPAPPPLRHVVA
jgi:hypothetical protein